MKCIEIKIIRLVLSLMSILITYKFLIFTSYFLTIFASLCIVAISEDVTQIITMDYAENILGTIGNTPLVKINKLTEELPCLVLAKYEPLNPGNSVKD